MKGFAVIMNRGHRVSREFDLSKQQDANACKQAFFEYAMKNQVDYHIYSQSPAIYLEVSPYPRFAFM